MTWGFGALPAGLPCVDRGERGRGRIAARLPRIVFLLLALAAPRPSPAATIHVPADQPTLRAAVLAAASGDVVLIAPGVHEGGVFVEGKTVTFASWFYTTSDTAYIAQTIISGVIGNVCGGNPTCRADAVLEFGSQAGGAVIGLTVTNGPKGIRSGSIVDISYCHVIGTADGTNYTNGGGGTFSNNLFADNGDDGVDLNGKVSVRVLNNIIRDNNDDGIEFRLYPHSGAVLSCEFSGNLITGNLEDGIQFIDYADTSSRDFRIERNVFANNALVALSSISNGPTDTVEDFSGAPMAERVLLVNNTFAGSNYGVVGGGNLVALNNIFTNLGGTALRRVAGLSIASYNLFWNNATNFDASNVDLATMLLVDPLLAPDRTLLDGSPAIDAGTALFQWQGQTVLDLPPSSYVGSAPDLGAFESSSGGPPPGNRAPGVDAGPNQSITLPAEAVLDGTVSDDGLPSPPAVTTEWTVSSGPGPVTFLDASAVDTRATFTTAGTYLLRLTANDGELSAQDLVQIMVQPAIPPGGATLERRIAGGGDDVEESAGGNMYLSSTDLELVYDTNNQTVGLRFTDVTVPQGATITHAYVQFQADETQSEATNLLIQGQAADNAGIFGAASGNLSSRPRTTASVSWSPPAWGLVGEAGANQGTPELAAVIQEIVGRPGWASGNALVLIIPGAGHRTAESYEGIATAAPLLHVEYTSGAPVVGVGERTTLPPPDLALHGVSPNPARGMLRVEFSLAEAGSAAVELLDLTGRRVASRDVGSLGPGRHLIELRDRFASGVYFVRLSQGGRARVTKAVVTR